MLDPQDPHTLLGHLLQDGDRLAGTPGLPIGAGEVGLRGQGVRVLDPQDPCCCGGGVFPVGDGGGVQPGVEQAEAGSPQQGVPAFFEGPEGLAAVGCAGGQGGGIGSQHGGQPRLVVVGVGPQGQDRVCRCANGCGLPFGGGLTCGAGGHGVDTHGPVTGALIQGEQAVPVQVKQRVAGLLWRNRYGCITFGGLVFGGCAVGGQVAADGVGGPQGFGVARRVQHRG